MAEKIIRAPELKSRDQAKAEGLKRYFTGKPCPHGHVAERYVSTFACLGCMPSAGLRWRTNHREIERAWFRTPHARERKRKNRERQLSKIAGRPKPQVCEVCGAGGEIHFDHCHATGQFRGWLCERCNILLGMAKDSSKTLRLLADFLDRFPRPEQLDLVTLAEATKAMGRYMHRRKGKWGRTRKTVQRDRSWA